MSKVKVTKNTKSEEKEPIPTQNVTITPEEEKAEPSLVVVTRKEWGAAPPNFPGLQQLKRPAMTVMLRYFTGWEICHTADECIPVLRGIQRRDQNKNLVDIAHNFLIGPDGTVFEGRGWTESESPDFDMAKVAQQIKQPQTIHQSIINLAYIGNFEGEDCVTEVMKKSLRDIIDQGIRCYQIAEKHKFMSVYEIM